MGRSSPKTTVGLGGAPKTDGTGKNMQIQPVSSTLLVDLSASLVVRPRAPEVAALFPGKGATIRDLATQIVNIRNSLERLKLNARVLGSGGGLALADAVRSSAPLGLVTQPTPTTLTGSEEVNTTPTSFTPFSPAFRGSSTASPLFGGIYDGTQGDDTLSFRVKKTGIVGVDEIDIEVRDGQGAKFETVTFLATDLPGTVKTLSNGLTLSLSAGLVDKHDTFELDVFATVGSAVDPDKPFDGTGNDNPNFELGLSVTAGSFFINGTQIDVLAGDTLNSVLARITSSSAGVSASFDAATERVVLTQKTPGSAGQIALGSDSTGFFAATKLSTATAVPGVDSELDQPISQVAALSGIGNGTFFVNQVAIDVDTSRDSLAAVITRINSSGAGAIASFDESRNEFQIAPATPGQSLELSDGTSGFFSGVKIAEGVYDPAVTKSSVSRASRRFARESELPRLIAEFGETLDELFTTAFAPSVRGYSNLAVEKVESAIREVFRSIAEDPERDSLRSGFGIDFDFTDPSEGVVSVDVGRLATAVESDPDALADFLLAEGHRDGRDGFLEALDKALAETGETLVLRLDRGPRGLVLDLLA